MTFLWVGYLVTWIALAAYAWRLEGRIDEARRHSDRSSDAGHRHGASA